VEQGLGMDNKTQMFHRLASSIEDMPPGFVQVMAQHYGVEAHNIDEFLRAIMPPPLMALKDVGTYYESEMITADKAGAHFAACLMGGALIESVLLLLVFTNRGEVEATEIFKKKLKKNDFSAAAHACTLDDLATIAEELNWIPTHVLDGLWQSGIVEAYREVAAVLEPMKTIDELESSAEALSTYQGYALLRLIQKMRNLVHGGRCVREQKTLHSPEFKQWAELIVKGVGEIRDCLMVRFQLDSRNVITAHLKSRAQAND
jgi:hypothetical protein